VEPLRKTTKIPVWIAGIGAENRTQDLPNTKEVFWLLGHVMMAINYELTANRNVEKVRFRHNFPGVIQNTILRLPLEIQAPVMKIQNRKNNHSDSLSLYVCGIKIT
jgi:hypothetical protein